jgi:VWFA-related protein
MKISVWSRTLCLLGVVVFVAHAQRGGPQGASPGLPSAPGRNVPAPNFPTAANTQPENQQAAAAIKTETILVPVRVVVRKPDGQAVADLKKEDFKLYQDGKPQEITGFTMIQNGAASAAPGTASSTSPSAATSDENSSGATAPAVAPTQFVALFFDDVHLSFADMAQTRDAARKYLASLRPEDRVAIVTASGQGSVDFTNDRQKLDAALAKLQPSPVPGGPGDACRMSYTEADAIQRYDSQGVTNMAAGDFITCYHIVAESAEAAHDEGEAFARAAAARTQEAGEEAADAIFGQLERGVRRLSTLPGRRVVVLISPGFVYSGRQKQFAQIISLANHYGVVINTLDSLGVYRGDPLARFGFGHSEAEQPILEDLADGTGGRFVKFNNDFAGVMSEMSEAPEAYYLLSYAPHNLPADGKYHVLKVSLARHSLDSVQARKGFYAPDQQETPEQAARREIDDALFSDDEQHDFSIKFETSVAQDAAGARKLSVKADVDPAQLQLNRANGVNQDNLTVAVALFDNDGNYLQGTWKSDQMDLKDATLAELNKTGFDLEIDFDVKPGDYVVRMVARDSNAQHISAENASVTVPGSTEGVQ